LSVQEDGKMGIADNLLLDRATELNRVVFTQDDDFLKEASLRQEKGKHFAGIVYAHQEKLPTGKCIDDLELIAKVYEPKDMHNRVEYLPL